MATQTRGFLCESRRLCAALKGRAGGPEIGGSRQPLGAASTEALTGTGRIVGVDDAAVSQRVVLTGIPSHPRDGLLRLAGRDGRRGRPPSEVTATRRQAQIRLSSNDIDRLVAAYHAGGRTTQLAAEFGVHRNTVQRLLRAQGAHLARGPRT